MTKKIIRFIGDVHGKKAYHLMATAIQRVRQMGSSPRSTYDSAVDVLYVAVGAPQDVEGEGMPGGLELGYSSETGKPCVITVLGYKRNHWSDRLDDLARIAGAHLHMSSKEVRSLITKAVEGARRT